MAKNCLAGAYYNNLHIGYCLGKTKVATRNVETKVRQAQSGSFPVRLYLAQHNFVDAEPHSLAQLQGQAIDITGNYIDLNAMPGETLFDLLQNSAPLITNITYFPDPVVPGEAAFITSFTHNSVTYNLPGTDFPVIVDDPNIIAGLFTGWAVMYHTSIHRPQRFETYPVLATNQYPLYPNIDDSPLVFTLEFTKTQVFYEINLATNAIKIQHGLSK